MNCRQTKARCSSLLDSRLADDERRALEAHLRQCEACAEYFAALRRNRWLLSTLPACPAPPQLATQIQQVLAHENSRRQTPWAGLLLRWREAINAFMFPAAAGICSAVVIFGLLIGNLVPIRNSGDDVPTALYTPPEMTAAPFGLVGNANGEPVLVEALIDAQGRVQDYRVLHGATAVTPELKNALLFAQFRPATSFGRPVSGRVVLSFSNINVGG